MIDNRNKKGRFCKKHLEAPYTNFVYKKAAWNKAKMNVGGEKYDGFHVFYRRSDAEIFVDDAYSDRKVMRVAVRGFLRSGTFAAKPSETWKEMKFI